MRWLWFLLEHPRAYLSHHQSRMIKSPKQFDANTSFFRFRVNNITSVLISGQRKLQAVVRYAPKILPKKQLDDESREPPQTLSVRATPALALRPFAGRRSKRERESDRGGRRGSPGAQLISGVEARAAAATGDSLPGSPGCLHVTTVRLLLECAARGLLAPGSWLLSLNKVSP